MNEEKLKSEFLMSIKDVETSLCDELSEAFDEYIEKSKEKISQIVDEKVRPDLSSKILNRWENDVISADADEKCRILLNDEAFEKLELLSIQIHKDASSIIDGKESSHEYNQETVLNEVETLAQNSRPFNYKRAEELKANIKDDLNFINDPDVYNMSLRLLYEYKNKAKIEKS